MTVPEAIPPTCDVFCDDFESGDVCAWDAAEPPQCGGLGGGESPAAIRVDEREYLFDLHGNIGQTNLWEGGVAQPPRVTTTVPSTNRLAGPLGDYDSRGNLIGYSTTSFTFDRLNRLIGRSVSGEPAYHFLYTADDERTLTPLDNASNQRWTMRDFGGKVLRTFVSSPSGVGLSKTYVHRGESLVAAIDNEADDVPVTSHHSTDHLGTPRLETAMTGALNQKWKYFPFGEEAIPASQEGTLLRFTGHERDIFNPGGPADDHDYMHARFSSPLTGRFLSVDTVQGKPRRPQSWNRYAYALGNPLKYVDPDGREAMIFIVAPSRADTNPKGVVGHSAIYVTSSRGNAGVSALGDFGFNRGVGAFIRGYVDQGREVKMFVLKTTAEQDAKMVEFIRKNPEGGVDSNGSIMTENCTGACVNVLQAGGVVKPDENPASYFFIASTPNSLEQNLQTGGLSSQVGAVVTFPAEDPNKPKSQPPNTSCPEGQHPNKSGGCS